MGRSVMTELDLDAIQARANAATDGPWERYGDGSHEAYGAANFEDTAYDPPDVTHASDRPADAELIAQMPTARDKSRRAAWRRPPTSEGRGTTRGRPPDAYRS